LDAASAEHAIHPASDEFDEVGVRARAHVGILRSVSDPEQGENTPAEPLAGLASKEATSGPAAPTGKAPVAQVTQPSATSPLAAAEAKRRLKQTTIGIAPPAVGSKAPPGPKPADANPAPERVKALAVKPIEAKPISAPLETKKAFASEPPTKPQTLTFGAEAPTKPNNNEGPSVVRPTDPPPRERDPASLPPRAPTKPPPPISAKSGSPPAVPSPVSVAPKNAPSVPPRASGVNSAPPPPLKAKANPPPVTANAKSTPASPYNETLFAVAPPPPPKVPEIDPLTSTRRSAPPIAPIVPRRRTPSKGIPAAAPLDVDGSPGSSSASPPTPIADAVAKANDAPARPSATPPAPITSIAPTSARPPGLRIAQGGLLGASVPTRTARAGTLICEILVRNGAVSDEAVDQALALQEERGGQIGRILVSLGACTEDAIAKALVEQLRLRRDGGFMSDISAAAREQKDVVGLKVLTRPTRTVVVLLLTDTFSLLLAALIATTVHWLRTYSELQTIDFTAWLVVGPAIALCMLTFLGLELYSPMAKSTPDEIRDITFSASLVHLGASLLSTLGDLPIVKWGVFVRGVWWVATLFLVPVIRSLVRGYFSVQPWWGIPVCVLGAAKTGRLVVRTLKAQPRSGLKPVMMLDDDHTKHGTLRASFTNEVMDVYSVNVSAAHFLTEAQRTELANDIFGDDQIERGSQPISSDHIPVAPEAWQGKVDVKVPKAADLKKAELKAPPSERGEQFFSPDSNRLSRSQITKDASQFPRGKFAEVDGVPLVGDLSLAPILATRLNIPYAVLAMPGVDSTKLLQIVERIGGKFTHLLIIPDLFGFATMGVPAKSLGGILGVEVRQQLLLPGPRLAKRCMDIALTAIGSVFVLPFLLLLALLIKLDSKGPVFYTQKRLGKDGTYFRAYKFRTMHGDGEERLKAILDADPALRAEYDIYHKLRKDPRVTRIGRILRKFSLDEFPQLLNVVKGDMSLVGPRPYIERELTEMRGQEQIILRAPPGMTGMWQVSDRNATSFAQRVQIDVYYVRNWSPWLDIHILAKTFGVVVKGSGV
jgi:exopolysaccharide biosynthesis polyprenyl glycosylphosphotransferase